MTEKRKSFIKSFTDENEEMQDIAASFYDNNYSDEEDEIAEEEELAEFAWYQGKLSQIRDNIINKGGDIVGRYYTMAIDYLHDYDPKSIVTAWEDNAQKLVDNLTAFDARMYDIYSSYAQSDEHTANEYTNSDFEAVIKDFT